MTTRKGSALVEIDREYAKATALERLFGAVGSSMQTAASALATVPDDRGTAEQAASRLAKLDSAAK